MSADTSTTVRGRLVSDGFPHVFAAALRETGAQAVMHFAAATMVEGDQPVTADGLALALNRWFR